MNSDADPAEQFDDLDSTTIQVQQLWELMRIRQLLEERYADPAEDADEPARYECQQCFTVVDEADRRQHAVRKHSAPPNTPVEDLGLFEPA